MRVGQRTSVHAAIAFDEASLKATPLSGPGESGRSEIAVAETVEVVLRAPGGDTFDVMADSGNGMVLLADNPGQRGEWSWTVRPLRHGDFDLVFDVRTSGETSSGHKALVVLESAVSRVSVGRNVAAPLKSLAAGIAIFVASVTGTLAMGDAWDLFTEPVIESPQPPAPPPSTGDQPAEPPPEN